VSASDSHSARRIVLDAVNRLATESSFLRKACDSYRIVP
jgi:hypothetical protein